MKKTKVKSECLTSKVSFFSY